MYHKKKLKLRKKNQRKGIPRGRLEKAKNGSTIALFKKTKKRKKRKRNKSVKK